MSANEHTADTRAIARDCEALSYAYARAVDFRDHDAFAHLFAEDGVLDAGELLEGREAIARAISRRPYELRTRHILSNIFIDVVSATEARGIAYLTLYRHSGPESLGSRPVPVAGPAAVGHYEDRFVRTAQGWKFARRKLHLAFTGRAAAGFLATGE